MGRIIPGDGPQPAEILVCGERPGREEYDEGRNFVGRAGQELWSRLWRICGISRDDCRVVNLVPTFSTFPPTAAEIAKYSYLLEWEMRHARPTYILTIGYHAARWFLPQFADTTGDFFHGLAFSLDRSIPRCPLARTVVLPACHAAAALREPEIFQNQFTHDLAAFDRVHRGRQGLHPGRDRRPYQVGLAGFGQEGQWLGLDTEGTSAGVECVTLARRLKEVACVELHHGQTPGPFLASAIAHAHVVIHHAKHDWRELARIGIDLSSQGGCLSVDDTMLQAYLLGLPQSLKVLAYRLFGDRMAAYEDLVRPLDAQLVRNVLGEFYVHAKATHERDTTIEKGRTDAARSGTQSTRVIPATRHRAGPRPDPRPTGSPLDRSHAIPRRALTSLHGILTKEAEKTPRARWHSSTFAPLVTLPPAPSWQDLPSEVRLPYTMMDAVAHLEVHRALRPRLKANRLQRIYAIDKGVLPWLVRNEQVGLACDKDRLIALSAEFASDFARVCRTIDRLAGYAVNPIGGQQVSDCLFGDRGVTPTRQTPSGKHFTTGDKYLKARQHEDALIPLILEARQLSKYKGTYTDKLPDMLRWDETTKSWRYHPDWKYTRTATGRLAETIILLIPKHTARGLQIRDAFYATPGHRLVACDLSQIEMRVMAHVSQDRVLLDVYRTGGDIHASTAYHVLGAPKTRERQDESRHRLPAKTFNFSIINGVTEYGLLDQLRELHCTKANGEPWDLDSVRQFHVEWFRVHKGVRRYWETQKALARQQGELRDLFGRRRQLSAIWSTDERIVASAERECLFGIQAAADAISKIWNKRIWKTIIRPWQAAGRYCEPWLRVHDDTMTECDRTIAEQVARQTLAAVPDLLCIPTLADVKIGRRWGSL